MRAVETLPATAALAAACAAGCLVPGLGEARAAFAIPLVLWLPGAALMRAAFPGKALTAETRVLSVALSMAMAVACGLALGLAGLLGPAGWALSLSGVTAAACLAGGVAALAAGRGAAEEAGPASRWGRADVALLLVAGILAGGAVANARSGAMGPGEYRYTEMWIVPAGPGDNAPATLGMRNAEGVRASYQVEFLDGGRVVGRWPPVDLAPGQTFTATVTATPARSGRRLEARLYRDGDSGKVYRRVWLAVPGARPETEE